MVSDAHLAIGRLDFAAKRLPDPSLLVRPTLRREAASTSALEGTYAPLKEVFEADFIDEANQSTEMSEIRNYIRSAERALTLVERKPICVSVISELQKILVKGTRGDSYDAGRLRDVQVFIGERSAGIEASRYVPPPPGDYLVRGMSDWETWLNAEDDIPLAVKIALTHYQFESLHPFSDGNGRIGRLIATLQLVVSDTLSYPVLNLSPWLEPRKDQYKDLMLQLSQTGNYDPWVQFFCEALAAQAQDTVSRIERLLDFRSGLLDRLRAARIRGVTAQIAEDLIGYPVITISEAAKRHSVTFPPASNAMAKLVELGVLREITGGSYGRVFVCRDVMQILLDS
jgi:Fic family protein